MQATLKPNATNYSLFLRLVLVFYLFDTVENRIKPYAIPPLRISCPSVIPNKNIAVTAHLNACFGSLTSAKNSSVQSKHASCIHDVI